MPEIPQLDSIDAAKTLTEYSKLEKKIEELVTYLLENEIWMEHVYNDPKFIGLKFQCDARTMKQLYFKGHLYIENIEYELSKNSIIVNYSDNDNNYNPSYFEIIIPLHLFNYFNSKEFSLEIKL